MTDIEITVRVGDRHTNDKGSVSWDNAVTKRYLVSAADRLDERSVTEAIRQANRLILEMIVEDRR